MLMVSLATFMNKFARGRSSDPSGEFGSDLLLQCNLGGPFLNDDDLDPLDI